MIEVNGWCELERARYCSYPAQKAYLAFFTSSFVKAVQFVGVPKITTPNFERLGKAKIFVFDPFNEGLR